MIVGVCVFVGEIVGIRVNVGVGVVVGVLVGVKVGVKVADCEIQGKAPQPFEHNGDPTSG